MATGNKAEMLCCSCEKLELTEITDTV